jgi:hypothetical protein
MDGISRVDNEFQHSYVKCNSLCQEQFFTGNMKTAMLCHTFGGDSLYVECPRYSCNISLIYVQVLYGHKHNSTMVLDASPGVAAPKMNKYFVYMAHVSSNRACAQDGYLKCPHPIIIDGDMRWDSG